MVTTAQRNQVQRDIRNARLRGRFSRGEQIRYRQVFGVTPLRFGPGGRIITSRTDPKGFFGTINGQVRTGLTQQQIESGLLKPKLPSRQDPTPLQRLASGLERSRPQTSRSTLIVDQQGRVTAASQNVISALGFDPTGRRLTQRQAELITGGVSGRITRSQAQRIIDTQAKSARAKADAQKIIADKLSKGQTVTIGDVLKAVTGKTKGFTAGETQRALTAAGVIARSQQRTTKVSEKSVVTDKPKDPDRFGGRLISPTPEPKGLGEKIALARERLIFGSQNDRDQLSRTFKGTIGLGALGVASGVYDFGYMILNPIESTKDMINMAKNPKATLQQLAFEFERDPAGTLAKFWTINKLSRATSKATTAAGKKALPSLRKLNKATIVKAVPLKYRALVEAAVTTTTRGRSGRILFDARSNRYKIITTNGRVINVPKNLNRKFSSAIKKGAKAKKPKFKVTNKISNIKEAKLKPTKVARATKPATKLSTLKKLGFKDFKEFSLYNKLSEQARGIPGIKKGSKVAKLRLDALDKTIKKRLATAKAKKVKPIKKKVVKQSKIDRDVARLDKKILKLQQLDKQKAKALDTSAKKLGFKNYREQVRWNELSKSPNSVRFKLLNKLIENRVKRSGVKSLKTAQAQLKRRRAIQKLSNERFINNEIKKALKGLKTGKRVVKKVTPKKAKKISQAAKRRVAELNKQEQIKRKAKALDDDLSRLQRSVSGQKAVLVKKVRSKSIKKAKQIQTAKPREFKVLFNKKAQQLFLDVDAIRFAKAIPGLTLSLKDPKGATVPINKIRSTPSVRVIIKTKLPSDVIRDILRFLQANRKPKLKPVVKPVTKTKPKQRPVQKPRQPQAQVQEQAQKPVQRQRQKLKRVRRRKRVVAKPKPPKDFKIPLQKKRVTTKKSSKKKKKKVKKKRAFTVTLAAKKAKKGSRRKRKVFTGLEDRPAARRRKRSKK